MRGTRNRPGISLLEVLISIGVLTVGILSLAVLIPVGRLAIEESIISDRAGTCGRACLRDIKVRGVLEPARWLHYTGQPATALFLSNPPVGEFALNQGAFVLDPLFLSQYVNDYGLGVPLPPYFGRPLDPNATNTAIARLTLHTGPLPIVPVPLGIPMPLPLAERDFIWQDDLAFHLPDAADQRPTRIATELQVAPGVNTWIPEIAGKYTWFVTVSPVPSETMVPSLQKIRYRVSVVVCYNRDLQIKTLDDGSRDETADGRAIAEGERTVRVDFLGSVGLGGGSVMLSWPLPDEADTPIREQDPLLELDKDQWIMVYGMSQGGYLVAQWYRVASVGEVVQNPALPDPPPALSRMAMLAGPDWDVSSYVNDGVRPLVNAVIVNGVVDVYRTTIELDRSLIWGQ